MIGPYPKTESRLLGSVIVPPTHLELIAVDHCNLTCRFCNHASPAIPGWFADPAVVRRDFAILAKYYRPAFIKVLGGEPLLHPRLAEVIAAARESGISRHFTLTTNGSMLHRADDAVWRIIDEMEISLYPGVRRAEENLALAGRKAQEFGKKLTICRYEQFRASVTTFGTENGELIEKIFATCKTANVWGCHGVREGFFYKCPQSMYIPTLTGIDPAGERLAIVDGPDFQTNLLAFVNAPTPLASCTFCLGTAGRQEPCTSLLRHRYREDFRHRTEDLVDMDWLERCLIVQDTIDDCKIPLAARRARFPGLSWWWHLWNFLKPGGKTLRSLREKWRPVRQSAEDARRQHVSAVKPERE